MKSILLEPILYGIIIISFSLAQVNTEWMRDGNLKKKFSNKVRLDVGYQASQDEIFDLQLSSSSNYYLENNLHAFLILNYQNGFVSNGNNKEVILNTGFSHLRFTKNLLSTLDIEFFIQAGFNDFILIRDRKLIGSGFRKNIIKNGIIKSYLGVGIMRESEKYDLKKYTQALLTRQTNYLSTLYQINDNSGLNNILYFQPTLGDYNDFRLLLENEMFFKINDVLAVVVSINYRYDNKPHENSKKTYLVFNNGFEFEF